MSILSLELIEKVHDKIEETVDLIQEFYGIKMPNMNVKFDIDSKHLAGQARYRSSTIRFNPAYLTKYQDRYIGSTVPHEVCHIGTRAVYPGAKGHGEEWMEMMQVVGIADPQQYHTYEADPNQGRQVTKYIYECVVCGTQFEETARVHNQIRSGRHRYHKTCGGGVAFVTVKRPKQLVMKVSGLPDNMSKMDKCRVIYTQYQHQLSRKQMIAAFVGAGCTSAGASTYFQTIAKEHQKK